jgi:uncharacterized protein
MGRLRFKPRTQSYAAEKRLEPRLIHFCEKRGRDRVTRLVSYHAIDGAMRAEWYLLGERTARAGPIFDLARRERFLAVETTANRACFYLGAIPDRPLVGGMEPMTLRQIKDRGHSIILRHSDYYLSRKELAIAELGWPPFCHLITIGWPMLPVTEDRMRLVHLCECMWLWRTALALGMLWPVHGTALAQKASPPLVEAAARGSVQGVRDLIAAGAGLNQSDENGITALIISAYAGNVEIVRLLLAVKADPDAANNDGETALHTSAAHANSAEIVPLLIAAGGNIEKADKWGRTPLLVQALMGRIGGIKALLAAGARIDARDEQQATAIHLAASNGHVSVLELLSANGASLILLDKFGSAPLHFAAHQGQADAVAWLLARGARLQQANADGLSPMALAIESGSWPAVKVLFDAGVTLKEPIAKQGAALNVALQFDRPAMVALLIEHGAPADLESNGFTPLLWAAVRGRADETRLLLAAGANPNLAQSGKKVLPLLLAAYTGHLSVVRLLVEHGANIHATNPQGGTALRSAADAGHIEIVRYLLGLGARSDIRDKFGLLPIDYARRNGHAEIVTLLSSPK